MKYLFYSLCAVLVVVVIVYISVMGYLAMRFIFG